MSLLILKFGDFCLLFLVPGFATEEDMLDFVAVQNLSNVDALGGVVFNTKPNEDGTVPPKVTYTIRMKVV